MFTLDHLSTKQQYQCKPNAMGNKFVLFWNTHEQNSSENANSTPRHLWQFSKHLLCLLVHLLALLNNKCISNVCLAGVASVHSMSQANLFGCYGHPPKISSSKQKRSSAAQMTIFRPMIQSPQMDKYVCILYVFRPACIFAQCSL